MFKLSMVNSTQGSHPLVRVCRSFREIGEQKSNNEVSEKFGFLNEGVRKQSFLNIWSFKELLKYIENNTGI